MPENKLGTAQLHHVVGHDPFARAESIMLADPTVLIRRREIDIRGRASCGDTIDVSTRISRLNNAGQNNWKLFGTARRRSDGHLLATWGLVGVSAGLYAKGC